MDQDVVVSTLMVCRECGEMGTTALQGWKEDQPPEACNGWTKKTTRTYDWAKGALIRYESQKKGRTTIEVKRKEIEGVNTRTRDALIKMRAEKGGKQGKDGKQGTVEKSKTKCKGTQKETGGKRCNRNLERMRPKKGGGKNGKGKTYRKGNTTATRGSRRP